ncbi:O-antigen polymerase [Sphingopyxis sp. EG6]|nr:O-antigen polymerase [Sphingopyxis sp. EG6]
MLALLLWMALQLVPLPPDLWHNMPGRGTIVAIDGLIGQSELWRPISLAPSQTWNAMLGMCVPLAALLLAAQTDRDDYSSLIVAMVLIACASALLGLVQILSGPSSPAYLYRISNNDSIVGLFSNRNHHAIFLAGTLLLIAALFRDELMRKRKRPLIRVGLVLAGVMLTILTILIGSRGGLVAGAFAASVSYAVITASWLGTDASRGPDLSRSKFARWLFYTPPALFALFVGAALMLSDRTTAFTRLMTQSAGDDLRVLAWPAVQSMIETYWLTGSGLGSFASVYKMFEADSLLRDAYFNHAHNDWAEVILTGGLPFGLILIGTIIWIMRSSWALGGRNLVKGYRGDLRLPILTVIALFAATSLIDYPLRVPSLQALAVFLIVFLCCPKPGRSR